jgi:UDP-N-acetylglucosamine--N-acetylmuramyl-(pentapeptide) pyrophosphoryl-undecaprenol N-acetylglucosamine transferase
MSGRCKLKVKKVLFASGGTGGHLFPAQALADQLVREDLEIQVFFAAAQLSHNAYLDKKKFHFCDISSTTPFCGSFFKRLKSLCILLKGVCQGFRLLAKEKPRLVVGFGSFHTFPILCAAVLKKIPLVLFESNAIPGKVVRLFSSRALLTGIYFSEAKKFLKGKIIEVEIPKPKVLLASAISKQAARSLFQLAPDLMTLLVFGGSQGAERINASILGLIPLLSQANLPFQLIHFTGNEESALAIAQLCERLHIRCYAKKFEQQMQVAWSASDVVICRSGAMTLAELLQHEVPGILIPYPFASDQHQLKNAQFLEKKVGGAIHLAEHVLTPPLLAHTLMPLIASDSQRRIELKKAIENFKARQKKADLGRLILEILNH